MSWSLRPVGLCRIGGLPVESVDELRASTCTKLLRHVEAADEVARIAGKELRDALHQSIAGCEARDLRRLMINLRRAVYGDRPAQVSLLHRALNEISDPALRALLTTYASLRDLREAWRQKALEAYTRESARTRRSLADMSADEDFRMSLMLASASMYRQVPEVADQGGSSAKWSKRERGLSKYFSRAAMKATPFGRFCAVIPYRLEPETAQNGNGAGHVRLEGDPARKRGVARVAKQVCGLFLPALLADPRVRRALPLGLNPTTELREDTVTFLADEGGREVFRKLARVPAITSLADELMKGERNLGDVCQKLAREHGQGFEEVERFVGALLRVGLLRLRTGIAEQDLVWEPRLAELMDLSEAEGLGRMRDFLRASPRLMTQYQEGSTTPRQEIAARLAEAVESGMTALGIKAPVRYDGLILEDATADATLRVPSGEVTHRATRELMRYVEVTDLVGWPRAQMATLRHVFDDHYGEETEEVGILRFYEDFYRLHQKEYLVRQADPSAGEDHYDLTNPFDLDIVAKINRARNRLGEVIWGHCRRAPIGVEEVRLSFGELSDAIGGGLAEPAQARSATVFCEFTNDRLGTIVLDRGRNAVGYGKFWSRFLPLFDPDFGDEVRSDNDRLSGDLLAEIYVDGSFNANLHPPLATWELEYPTVEARCGGNTLQVGALSVVRDRADPHGLLLRHRESGAVVRPVDLGFLSPTIRPQLFQMLTWFTPSRAVGLEDLARIAIRDPSLGWPSDRPISLPRVRLGDHLVLFRRRWLARSGALPEPHASGSQFETFAGTDRWRRAMGLPTEVYVRMVHKEARPSERASRGAEPPAVESPAEDVAAGETEPKRGPPTNGTGDDTRKPQYVAFDTPALVELFVHMCKVARAREALVVFEERYPPATDLGAVTPDGARYASEVVLQIDRTSETET